MKILEKVIWAAVCVGFLGGGTAFLPHSDAAPNDPVSPPAARAVADDVAVVEAAIAAGPRQLSPEAFARSYASEGIDLSALSDLSPEAAAVIAAIRQPDEANQQTDVGVIDLSGLRQLSVPVAERLAAYWGRLLLDGIEELSPEVAVALSKKGGEHGCISLTGLRTLTPQAARAVGGCKNVLSRSFPRLRTLPPEAVRELIDGIQRNPRRLGGAVLDLSGIESLTPELAAELANNRGVTITLGGLRELSPEAAVALEKYRGNLCIGCPGGRLTPELLGLMNAAGVKNGAVGGGEWTGIKFHLVGLEVLTPEDVAKLAQANPFNPWLGGIQRLTQDTAKAVVAQLPRNALYFPNLVDVPAEFAGASLANKDLQIGFDPEAPLQLVRSAEKLTREIARIVVSLGDSGVASSLDGITAIESPDAAQIAAILATSNAGLALPNLYRISPKTLAALLKKEDVEIPLIETLELIAEPDGGPTEDFVVPEGFEKRQQAARQRAKQQPVAAVEQPDDGADGPKPRKERRRPRARNRAWGVEVQGAKDLEVIKETPEGVEFRFTIPAPNPNQNQK